MKNQQRTTIEQLSELPVGELIALASRGMSRIRQDPMRGPEQLPAAEAVAMARVLYDLIPVHPAFLRPGDEGRLAEMTPDECRDFFNPSVPQPRSKSGR
ncbi:MAG: hypothetical protein AAFR17_12355 [Pseudomonadota bacterium]